MRPPGRVCLVCRHVVPRGAPGCDLPGHQVIGFDPSGRTTLVASTWGPVEERAQRMRARQRRSERAGTAGVIAGAAAGLAAALASGVPVGLAVSGGVMVGAIAGGVGGLLRGEHVDPRRPRGAVDVRPSPPFARGVVVGADDQPSPASDVWAAAWAIELTLSRPDRPRVMLRDSYTGGFDVRLDGGELARVPPGPWRPAGAPVALLDVDDERLAAHLRDLDPWFEPHDPLGPLFHDGVREAVIHAGERVELCGAWDPVPDDRVADPSLYRDAPPTVRVPTGWPVLRRVRG